MAVGSMPFPKMRNVNGVKLGTICAGIKQNIRDDLLLIELAEDSSCAGVFTKNAFCAAPVHVAKMNLNNAPRWFLVNSGNANAGTGKQGMDNARIICNQLAELVDGDFSQVLPFSTGVIGENLPVTKISAALPGLCKRLAIDHWSDAATAIMTTDTFPKGASLCIDLDGEPVTITGIAKGAGMIQPNMATMLAFIATDARIDQSLLQKCLSKAVDQSFNCITVDGDTSTNDACMIMASGKSSAPEILPTGPHYQKFSEAVLNVCSQLAEAIVRDGEGATKLIRILVKESRNEDEAMLIGKTIAHSPLVKTAFFASDPNWGRILAAVGRTGIESLNCDTVSIFLGDVCIVENGGRAEDYTESKGQAVMNQNEVTITVAMGRGTAEREVLTCDLSYDYVRINAEYRT